MTLKTTTQATKVGVECVMPLYTHPGSYDGSIPSFRFGVSLEDPQSRKPVIVYSLPDSFNPLMDTQPENLKLAQTVFGILLLKPTSFNAVAGLMASGEYIEGNIGSGAESSLTSLAFCNQAYKSKQVSALVGNKQGYPTFTEMITLVQKIIEESDIADTVMAYTGCTEEQFNTAAREVASLVRMWTMTVTSAMAVDFLAALWEAIISKFITNVEDQGNNEVVVTWSPSANYLPASAKTALISSGITKNMVGGFIENIMTAGKFSEVVVEGFDDPLRFQHVTESSAYSQWMKGMNITLNDLDTTSQTAKRPADADDPVIDEITALPNIPEMYNNGDNARIYVPRTLLDSMGSDFCLKLEKSTACIGLAASLGILSQSKNLTSFATNLEKFPTLGAKELKKQYSIRHVVPDVVGELNHKLLDVDIPKFEKAACRKIVSGAISDVHDAWWTAVGKLIPSAVLQENVYETPEGDRFIVIRNSTFECDKTIQTYHDALLDDKSWGIKEGGNPFWAQVLGPKVKTGLLVLPLQSVVEKEQAPMNQTLENTLACFEFMYEGKQVVCNGDKFFTLYDLEYEHCINAYKARAEESMAINRQTGNRKKNMWWLLLLLLIPVVALIVYAGGREDASVE